MLRKIALILGIILLPSLALAAFVPLPVNQGGTGWGYPGGLESGRIIFGSGNSRVGTSTNLFWDNTNSRLGVGSSTPLRDLDVLGTFSFGLQDSPLKKAEWTNLRYGESKLISGGDISSSGATDNWSVGSTTAEVNGRLWSSDSINGTVATSTFMIANKSIKDPYIYKEGSTYYAFYTVVSNSLGITDSDLGYATSQDLRNWTDQGVLINHTSWWGGSTLPVWAPSVIKVGSTYYIFVTTLDGGTFKMGYATASTLTGTYTFVDYVKDAGGSVINYLDPHVVYYNGLYYMVAGNGDIKLWTATSLSANSWTLKSTLATITRNWENTDGVFEAPFLVPGTPNLLFYGASGSHDDQRIGLAVSNHIDGPYTKVGVDGQVFLDSPSEAVGPIDHPAVYYDKESSRWYLFASHGTTAGGHLFQRLAGYSSSDLSSWQSIATSSQLKPNVTNYVYVNPSGQLMAAADLPYDSGRDGTFPERQGYLRLGSLTVNSSRQVTASSAFQGKKSMLDWFGIGTSTPGTPLSITGEGVFTGRVTAPSYNATSTTVSSIFTYASTTALTVGGSGSALIVPNGNVGIGTTSPYVSLGVAGTTTAAGFVATSSSYYINELDVTPEVRSVLATPPYHHAAAFIDNTVDFGGSSHFASTTASFMFFELKHRIKVNQMSTYFITGNGVGTSTLDIGIYTEGGILLGQATTDWIQQKNTNNYATTTATLSSTLSLAPGNYYIGYLINATSTATENGTGINPMGWSWNNEGGEQLVLTNILSKHKYFGTTTVATPGTLPNTINPLTLNWTTRTTDSASFGLFVRLDN